MAAIVAISNFLVQFPVYYLGMENILTYAAFTSVSYTHLRAHETPEHIVCGGMV